LQGKCIASDKDSGLDPDPKIPSLHAQSGPVIIVPVPTRLSPRERLKQETHFVFDDVDGKYTPAEL
jgi:hypothetical protein